MEAIQTINPSITLAIFPFENLTEGNKLAIFCKSFCIDLITELSAFRQFQIIAYDSVKNINALQQSDNENIQDFYTDYHIQGSFRNDEDSIRINAQLFNSHTHHLVWANRFEGKLKDLLKIQDELLNEVVSSLQQQLNADLLSQIRKKPKTKLKAYECWLYGMEEIKKGNLEADRVAREYFQQAIDIDPNYSLAYSGMSLTYFNEWTCQLWERWEVSQTGAFEWAERATELDEQNYIAALVLGRVFLYEGAYESAEHYLRKSLALNSNDPDNLIQIASCFTFLGYVEEAYQLYQKVLRINPSNIEAYYGVGVFILFELGDFKEAESLIAKARASKWVDIHAYYAAVYFHLKAYEKMQAHWEKYLVIYQRFINSRPNSPNQEATEWMMKVNPYKGKTHMIPFWEHVHKGLSSQYLTQNPDSIPKTSVNYAFLKDGSLWSFSFRSDIVQLPEVKGFYDLQKLLANPYEAIHCAELMGNVLESEGEFVMDEKAKHSYQRKILSLQEEIEEAENLHNFEKVQRLQEEYDQILEHLSQSLGLNAKVRKSGNPIEKARSAITWRIRSAISKIEKVHPTLGKHLSNTIKTGTFCSYSPEKELTWAL